MNARFVSPIEKRMLHAASTALSACEFNVATVDRLPPLAGFVPDRSILQFPAALIAPQVPIGRYRADLVIACEIVDEENGWTSLVVECDGHDFHDRTPEQASRDRARDRLFQSLGFTVFRFTGSDINTRGDDCAQEIARLLYSRCWGSS